MLQPLKNCFSQDANMPWLQTECSMVSPYKLEELAFYGLLLKYCRSKFDMCNNMCMYV